VGYRNCKAGKAICLLKEKSSKETSYKLADTGSSGTKVEKYS